MSGGWRCNGHPVLEDLRQEFLVRGIEHGKFALVVLLHGSLHLLKLPVKEIFHDIHAFLHGLHLVTKMLNLSRCWWLCRLGSSRDSGEKFGAIGLEELVVEAAYSHLLGLALGCLIKASVIIRIVFLDLAGSVGAGGSNFSKAIKVQLSYERGKFGMLEILGQDGLGGGAMDG